MFDFDPMNILWYGIGTVVVLSLFVWLVVWVERRVRWHLQSLWRRDGVDRAAVREAWKLIEEMGLSSNEHELRQAVVKADSLLDDVLKRKDMVGENMARRMKFAMHRYPELRAIWRSHHLRNQIVHEHEIRIKPHNLRCALKDYKKVLRILGAL